MSKSRLWFSLYDSKAYTGNEPAFKDMADYTGISELENNYTIVYGELMAYLARFEMQPQFNVHMVEVPKSWKVRSLRVWDVEMYDVQKHFPVTLNLLSKVPNVVNIGFNLLEPQSRIRLHSGDTNAIYRCHLGLKIPGKAAECVMKVKDETRNWEEGRVLAFTDAYEHEAWNNSNEQRIIMLFDIMRPEFLKKRSRISATVLGCFYLQQVANYLPWLYKINRSIYRVIMFPAVVSLQVLMPLRNALKKPH